MRPIRAIALVLVLAAPALAQDDLSGTYTLKGKEGFWGSPPRFTTTLTISRTSAETYDVVRTVSYDGTSDVVGPLRGTAEASTRRENGGNIGNSRRRYQRLKVTWKATPGAVDALDRIGDDGGTLRIPKDLNATYKIYADGKITGWATNLKRNGETKKVHESGKGAGSGETPIVDENSLPVDPALTLEGPAGAVLQGQRLTYRAQPATAKIEIVSGKATISGSTVTLSQPGVVRLQAQQDGKGSEIVSLEALVPEVTGITVQNSIALQDAKPPHWKRALGQSGDAAWEPAVILKGTPLSLSVKLSATKDLTEATLVRLEGRGQGGLVLSAEASLRALASGQDITVTSNQPLTNAVAVNEVELNWRLAERSTPSVSNSELGLQSTELRVYTVHARPVDNPMPRYAPTSRQGKPLLNKLHFELACTWAGGRTTNTGNDGNSICHKADNHLSHLVHGHNAKQKVPHYPEGADAPVNYDDLRGSVGSNGIRGVAGLYYPPLDVTKPYQEYSNYRNNFGWWVLENPRYVGGRCNQQASLICDVFGTLGVKAEVYYIERTARGPRTGRPMRRYYKSSRSDKSWNFHGQAKAYLDDGSEWLYDGSGSWPPSRINGKVEDLMKVPNGPYIDFWNPWRYEDGYREMVPAADIPSTWRGVPLMAGEEAPTPANPLAGTTAGN